MSNIEWKDGAVCFATNQQRYANDDAEYIVCNLDETVSFNSHRAVSSHDFQLNEIREGDYIPAPYVNSKEHFDNAVEVFGLFGFEFKFSADDTFNTIRSEQCIFSAKNGLMLYGSTKNRDGKRLTYPQLMAIGKLKQAMIERDEVKLDKNEDDSMKIVSDSKFKEDDKPKLATQYLNECIAVQKQRGEQYDSSGTGERSFDAAAKAFNALTGQNLKGSDVCLLLTCVKAVRQYSNPSRLHEDSLLDGVSYLSLWAEELNKELK